MRTAVHGGEGQQRLLCFGQRGFHLRNLAADDIGVIAAMRLWYVRYHGGEVLRRLKI